VLQINLDFAALILILVVVIVVRYLLLRKTRRRSRNRYIEASPEQEAFLNNFNVVPYDDFSAFDFMLGSFSHISPFPRLVEGEWRYTVYLTSSEVEDMITLSHEISECTLGRVIENQLNLKKPLYLQRIEDHKFWVHGKKQKYLIEHFIATLGEVDELTPEKLGERLHKEEIKSLILPPSKKWTESNSSR